MATKLSLATLEDHGEIAVVRFAPRDQLYTSDSSAMIELWSSFDRIQIEGKRVAYFQMPKDYLAPALVDEFWERARAAPSDFAPIGGLALPQIVAAADASMHRSLDFLQSLSAWTVGAVEGEVDFDLLGLLLSCNYRLCSADTTFVNRTIERGTAPGSGTPWFLARLIGIAKVKQLYLNGATISASEAQELGIVDQVTAADSLEDDGLAAAERFAAQDRSALHAMTQAMDLVRLDFNSYIRGAGTGYDRHPR